MSKVILRDKNLLVISPNFFTPIREETLAVSNYFSTVYVVIPQPYFPRSLLRIKYIYERYQWISLAYPDIAAFNKTNIRFYHPKSLIVPLNFIKRRTEDFFASSLLQTADKNDLKADLIHAHRLNYAYMGACFKEKYSIPLLATTHGSDVYDFPFKGVHEYSIIKYVLKNADHIIAISHREASYLSTLGYPYSKISVIPNPVDTKLFRCLPQDKCRALLGLPVNKKILLSIGSLTKVKGHTYLLEAMTSIAPKRKDVILVIIGAGSLRKFLLNKIGKLKLNQKVLLVGEKPHKEIPLWLNSADLFILPSINEGIPSSLLEAIACGKPVVASNVGGIPDIVSTSDIGLLVPPRDSEALSNAILEALDRHWDTNAIRKHAMRFSLENIANQITELYLKFLK
jgi:glycosyltransferase involved in cell wall biosynthesis